jgi:hypothetical protein
VKRHVAKSQLRLFSKSSDRVWTGFCRWIWRIECRTLT